MSQFDPMQRIDPLADDCPVSAKGQTFAQGQNDGLKSLISQVLSPLPAHVPAKQGEVLLIHPDLIMGAMDIISVVAPVKKMGLP